MAITKAKVGSRPKRYIYITNIVLGSAKYFEMFVQYVAATVCSIPLFKPFKQGEEPLVHNCDKGETSGLKPRLRGWNYHVYTATPSIYRKRGSDEIQTDPRPSQASGCRSENPQQERTPIYLLGFLSKLGAAEQETDEIPTIMVWNRRFSVINDGFTKEKPVKTVDLYFYTDAAFFGRNAGAAVVVMNREGLIIEEEAIYLGQNSSAYQAEILAIKSAAELIQLRWPEY